MTATFRDIQSWLRNMRSQGCSHMIVVCDTYDWEDYPIYVEPTDDVNEVINKYQGKNMQIIMEVYSANHTDEEQLGERRAFHYD